MVGFQSGEHDAIERRPAAISSERLTEQGSGTACVLCSKAMASELGNFILCFCPAQLARLVSTAHATHMSSNSFTMRQQAQARN